MNPAVQQLLFADIDLVGPLIMGGCSQQPAIGTQQDGLQIRTGCH